MDVTMKACYVLIDLDDTLYPVAAERMHEISQRITSYVAK